MLITFKQPASSHNWNREALCSALSILVADKGDVGLKIAEIIKICKNVLFHWSPTIRQSKSGETEKDMLTGLIAEYFCASLTGDF